MVNVTLTWNANPAAEMVTSYIVTDGAVVVAEVTSAAATIPDVAAGAHSYTVAAKNILGTGPASSPVIANIPAGVPGMVVNLSITNISVS